MLAHQLYSTGGICRACYAMQCTLQHKRRDRSEWLCSQNRPALGPSSACTRIVPLQEPRQGNVARRERRLHLLLRRRIGLQERQVGESQGGGIARLFPLPHTHAVVHQRPRAQPRQGHIGRYARHSRSLLTMTLNAHW